MIAELSISILYDTDYHHVNARCSDRLHSRKGVE
jgi:hypothetical protein